MLTVPVAGDSANVESKSAIRRLHDEYIPEIFGGVSAAEVYVTGETAYTMEFYDTAKKAVFIVFPFVLAMSFLLLMLVFRSIIVPIKAIILNLLSVGASYGLLVLVFQEGIGRTWVSSSSMTSLRRGSLSSSSPSSSASPWTITSSS